MAEVFRWRELVNIQFANQKKYTIETADGGSQLRAKVSFTDLHSTSSFDASTISANKKPRVSYYSGNKVEDATLSASNNRRCRW